MAATQKNRAEEADSATGGNVDQSVRDWGGKIFELMDAAGAPSLFSRKGLYGTLMEWAMRDERFKTQLFRFVDVLPTLNSSAEISRHLKEYLDNDQVNLAPALRAALKATTLAGGLFGGGIKSQVTGMARMFMIGSEEKEIVAALRKLHEQGIAFTVDILGEAVVSELEADQYAQRYLDLMNVLARETGRWGPPCRSDVTPRGEIPRLNVSIKISALYSQIHPADPDTAIEKLSGRLRPILRRAKELRAFINFDMESYILKNLTLRLFKSVFSEPEFADGPGCGLAMQAYLQDCEADLRDIVSWARARKRRITIRLVKGAYWDYETISAEQKGWPIPVFSRKAETDACFERLSLYLLENDDFVNAAFGTHNVRSIAHALAQAGRLHVPLRHFEFQMLYGMADSIKSALLQLDCRVREYTPVGELLPGMAYLVRRLLENTSNEGFLANKFAKGASREELLRSPLELAKAGSPSSAVAVERSASHGHTAGFANEPPTDFTIPEEREKIRAAIQKLRAALGQRHPLTINNKSVQTRDWTASLNPANQKEVIGYAGKANIADAEAALAAARAAQPKWARVSVEERAALLERVADLLRREKTGLMAVEILEAGKSWTEADSDVAEAIDFCNFYVAGMRALAAPQRTQWVAGESNVQHWWPRGVGVVIAPWNFPLAILTGMMSAAVVAGNSVVIKPSEQTPVIAARLMELLIEAGLPAGVVNLLTGRGSEIGAHLVAHPQIDFVAFTGSREVGLKIWETAGRTAPGQSNLKKVVCEMGGKNCLIVDSDADMDEAVAGVLQSAFGYQGQKCSALSRLVVLADNHEKFVERLIAATASLCIGPAEQPGNVIGPVIDLQAQQRILEMIGQGRKEAVLAWQGRAPDGADACYVPPTIFTEVKADCRIFREEIFGPVLTISRARDLDEALALANHSEFALTGGCYSRSPVNLERVRNEMICGNLYLNRPITGAVVGRQPFGGFKMSGGGTKAGGREYLQNFLFPRVITENCMRRGFAPPEESGSTGFKGE
jgi:RHH-type proline utilization regulon transcriptional repressor/proline dehydrogenase/delta 1-pyrroline-5-carboxylate dehydrogenase